MNKIEKFEQNSFLYRNKITKIRSLLKRNPYPRSLSDYELHLIGAKYLETLINKDIFDGYEERLKLIIDNCLIAIELLKEAEKIRNEIIDENNNAQKK